ncbi:MAG: hypothetical protein LBI44_00670 [Oscillospiraceae bacterium]|jgi:hypothetical protein|nr:hypothetical protein [Oscillospiraceae bacterium]
MTRDGVKVSVMPITESEKRRKIAALFGSIMSEDIIIDSNGSGEAERCRAAMRHCQRWAYEKGEIAFSHITTSESQGYGLLMTAYAEGCGLELPATTRERGFGSLRVLFNALLRAALAFPSAKTGDKRLMAWQLFGYGERGGDKTGYGEKGGVKTAPFWVNKKRGGCATDGDMDIIFALLAAQKLWGEGGEYNYGALARERLGGLWERCVHERLRVLLAGDWAKGAEGVMGSAVRLSDIMPEHIKAFAAADSRHDWASVADASYNVISCLCERNPAPTGLLPDFAVRRGNSWVAPEGKVLEADDGAYSYNACRAPWRLGADYLRHGDTPLPNGSLWETVIKPLHCFSERAAGGDPERLGPMRLDGAAAGAADPDVFAAPFLVTAACMPGGGGRWGEALWSWRGSGEYNGDNYGDYLKLLSMMTAAGYSVSPF